MSPLQKKSTVYVFLAWLGCLVAAGVGALIASGISTLQDDHRIFGSGLSFIGYDFLIFIAAFMASIMIPRRVGIKISGDPELVRRQVWTLACIPVAMVLSLFAWSSAIGEGLLYPALGIAVVVEIVIYFALSRFVFLGSDKTRVKVWSPLCKLIMLVTPALILHAVSVV